MTERHVGEALVYGLMCQSRWQSGKCSLDDWWGRDGRVKVG